MNKELLIHIDKIQSTRLGSKIVRTSNLEVPAVTTQPHLPRQPKAERSFTFICRQA